MKRCTACLALLAVHAAANISNVSAAAWQSDGGVAAPPWLALQELLEGESRERRAFETKMEGMMQNETRERRIFEKDTRGQLLEISEAVVTSATHERLDACAQNMTLILFAPNWANPVNDTQCTAMPMLSASVEAEHTTLLLTSAHCFMNISAPLDSARVISKASVFYFRALYACRLVHHFFTGPISTSADSQR